MNDAKDNFATCLSDHQLDLVIAMSADEPGYRECRVHLQGCRRCIARHSELVAQYHELRLIVPPLLSVDSAPAANISPISSRRHWRSKSYYGGWIGAGAAALIVVAWLLPQPKSETLPTHDVSLPSAKQNIPALSPRTRTKAGVDLSNGEMNFSWGIYINRLGNVARWQDGVQLASGDRLRFYYSCNRPTTLAIVGIGAIGEASAYFPIGEYSLAIVPGAHVVLDGAVELDDSVGDETLVAFVCSQPRLLSELVAQAAFTIEGCQRYPISVKKVRGSSIAPP